MTLKINSREYWENRFRSLDWRIKEGEKQSFIHAKKYIQFINIPKYFDGTICDFGCAEGDAFVVYKKLFPKAKLIGIDFSETAIKFAKMKYGKLGEFVVGDATVVPKCDIIICSHIFEHIENEDVLFETLVNKCQKLFIIVPYKENLGFEEHLRTYDEHHYDKYKPISITICGAGFSMSGFELVLNVYIKNIFRPFLGKKIIKEPKQIIYEFIGRAKY
jgi:hypothetical protein